MKTMNRDPRAFRDVVGECAPDDHHPRPRPRLSVIVVGYEGADLIGPCLRSIRKHCAPDTEIILVDNASSDETVRVARSVVPELRVIEMGRNAGYGSAANAGVAQARGEYGLLLNQDLELESGLRPVLARLEQDPELALVGCRLRFPDGRAQFGLGREHTPWRMVASWMIPLGTPWLGPRAARIEVKGELYDRAHADLDWVSGAFLAFRRRDWLKMGGMDEDFFLYVEDVELARRLRNSGRRVGYEPTVSVCHREAAGKDWPGERALAWTFDGYLRHAAKHGAAWHPALTRAGLLVACAWRAALHGTLAAGSAGLRGGPRQATAAGGQRHRLHLEKARAFLRVGLGLLWR